MPTGVGVVCAGNVNNTIRARPQRPASVYRHMFLPLFTVTLCKRTDPCIVFLPSPSCHGLTSELAGESDDWTAPAYPGRHGRQELAPHHLPVSGAEVYGLFSRRVSGNTGTSTVYIYLMMAVAVV